MKKEIFDFSEALRRMKEGKKVRRVIWKECGAYIHIVSETIVAVCDGKFFPCVFKDSEDILATDWEEIRMEKKVLALTVSKQWFNMIADGKKDEEYREIKPYWVARLFHNNSNIVDARNLASALAGRTDLLKKYIDAQRIVLKQYTHVLFINGYRKDSPRIEKEIESITIGKPKKGLCPDKWLDTEFFIIKFK